MSLTQKYEENPFEQQNVAQEWINSVENESGMMRDRDFYPSIRKWAQKIRPSVIIDIGSGQGICADLVQIKNSKYIGIEPSTTLVQRAIQKYSKDGRQFLVGNAYNLPFRDESADAALLLNVWFHLKDLKRASSELSRVLCNGGKFLIITADPEKYSTWDKFFFEALRTDEKIDGKVHVPINPLSRNIFYKHSMSEITNSLTAHNLVIDEVTKTGTLPTEPDPIFIEIHGHKT